MKNLITKIVLTIIFTACLPGVAAAQIATQSSRERKSFASVRVYTGTEISGGRFDSMNTMLWGNTYVLTGTNEQETHSLTISLDYYDSQPNGGNGFAVMSGMWSLVVFRNNAFAGTLYGDVSGGAITFLQNDDGGTVSKRTNAVLKVNGGTGIFKKRKIQIINCIYEATTEFSSNQTTGTLNLNR